MSNKVKKDENGEDNDGENEPNVELTGSQGREPNLGYTSLEGPFDSRPIVVINSSKL